LVGWLVGWVGWLVGWLLSGCSFIGFGVGNLYGFEVGSFVGMVVSKSLNYNSIFSSLNRCHLLGRLLSMMGTYWEAAFAICLLLTLDRFHMLNHIAHFCVGALNPNSYPQIKDQNTQSCEQTNRWANKHKYVLVSFTANDLR